MLTPGQIVNQMYANDAFSKWLGIEIIEAQKGRCILKMQVREEMTNGFGIAHGGITFSLADSALAFASNSNGRHAVSIECDINHILPVKTGDILVATATESSLSNRIGIYHVEVSNQDSDTVAVFKGMVYRKADEWVAE